MAVVILDLRRRTIAATSSGFPEEAPGLKGCPQRCDAARCEFFGSRPLRTVLGTPPMIGFQVLNSPEHSSCGVGPSRLRQGAVARRVHWKDLRTSICEPCSIVNCNHWPNLSYPFESEVLSNQISEQSVCREASGRRQNSDYEVSRPALSLFGRQSLLRFVLALEPSA